MHLYQKVLKKKYLKDITNTTPSIKYLSDGTLGGACNVSNNCTDPNTVCDDGICICDQGYSDINSLCIEGPTISFIFYVIHLK